MFGTILLAFLSYNELAFAFQVIPRCSGRCLPLSSNLPETGRPQEKAKTREINTWYPIPRKQKELLLFDIRKNSQAATNFNKLHPKGADGYPHANDFPRPLQKGGGVEKEFGIRFWSLSDGGTNRSEEMERLVLESNDKAGGGAISFAFDNGAKKSNADELGLEDGDNVNNTFTTTNKLEERVIVENSMKKNDVVLLNNSDTEINFSIEYQKAEKAYENKNNFVYTPDAVQDSTTMITVDSRNPNINSLNIELTVEENDTDIENNFEKLLALETANETDIRENNHTQFNENFNSELKFFKNKSNHNLKTFELLQINRDQLSILLAKIPLKINDKNLIPHDDNDDKFNQPLLSTSKVIIKAEPNQNTNNLLNLSILQDICKIIPCIEEEIDMKVQDFDDGQLHKISPPKIKRSLPLRKRRSIDTLKHSDEDRIRVRNKTFEHNKRYELATDFSEMVKLHHQREGADLKKEDFITLRTSDNVPVVPESWKSYQTGTPVRDKVTTSPLLPNEVPWKNDSVPRSSYEDRKKSELQIHEEEDSLDKDLEVLRMETGIGDQLRNDIKEREPKGGHYIYIRLRDFHGSLKELEEFGNQKENQQKETLLESSKTGDLSTSWAILQLKNSESNNTEKDSVEELNAKIYSVLIVSKNWTMQRYGKLSHRNHKRLTTQATNIKTIEDILYGDGHKSSIHEKRELFGKRNDEHNRKFVDQMLKTEIKNSNAEETRHKSFRDEDIINYPNNVKHLINIDRQNRSKQQRAGIISSKSENEGEILHDFAYQKKDNEFSKLRNRIPLIYVERKNTSRDSKQKYDNRGPLRIRNKGMRKSGLNNIAELNSTVNRDSFYGKEEILQISEAQTGRNDKQCYLKRRKTKLTTIKSKSILI
ncbi:uncharacterized protein CDAR_204521 [Caerostris darwini]|uniref:Uncharacterized protein n=1 Tax=Caerostris darwini TaxID=1538125 RepID=A0AAV4QZ64_9ARAC|nr:uncharacterized protein CDAR_204521 [Caerostris darwini]